MSKRTAGVFLLGIAAAAAILLVRGPARNRQTRHRSEGKTRIGAALGRLPVYFVENRGQEDPRVAFSVPGRDATVYFTSEGVTFALTRPERRGSGKLVRLASKESREPGGERWAVKLDFVGANPSVVPSGRDQAPAVWSYFNGPSSRWKAGLRTYESLVYEDLWPGIDLVYGGNSGRLKYSFLVKPGADPARIRLAYRGATGVRVNGNGQLEISTPVGNLSDDVPYAYQEAAGRRVEVPMRYALAEAPEAGSLAYGFGIGEYDRSLPLVLDPSFTVFAGYIGGAGEEFGQSIAVDAAGNVYIAGSTRSTAGSFPETAGPDLTPNGGRDAFVAKVRADGTGLVYAGYLGGSELDNGTGVAVDSGGNAYVVGWTTSGSGAAIPFPAVVGPQLSFSGIIGFVAKVNATGTALVYSGFIGGGLETANGVAVDSTGAAYVVGETETGNFPTTVGPDLSFNGGDTDAFVSKVRPDGTGLVYSGLIGGAGADFAFGVALDSARNAYVVGTTNSNQDSFPVLGGPDLSFNGPNDAFVAKVRADGTGLLYAGYIGGAYASAVAVDSSGNAYLTGETGEGLPFPATIGPDLTFNGDSDAFVAKVNANAQLVYAGIIGGSGRDLGYGIAVDSAGSAHVVGEAGSGSGFPIREGPDVSYNGGDSDAFLVKVRPDGTGFLFAGFFGGSGEDVGNGLALDSGGNANIVGNTLSDASSFPVKVGPDLTFNGVRDAFVAKISVKPDLLEGGLTQIPTAAKPGTSFTLFSTAVSDGLGTAPSSTTRYYISADEEKSADDIRLNGSKAVPSLPPATVTSGSANVTIPATTALGAYFVLACADDSNSISEFLENNNCGPSSQTIQVTLPDLRVTGQSAPPASANPGNRITVSDAVRNFGAVGAGASATRYYFSTNTSKSADDIRLTGNRSVPALAAGADSGFSVSVTIPTSTPLGTYHILACADDLTAVAETDETNNCRATTGTTSLTSPAFDRFIPLKPSGRVATVTVLATCTDGAEIHVTVSIEQGEAFGQGKMTGKCTGEPGRYPVTVSAEGPDRFGAGPAVINAEAAVKLEGELLDDHFWTRTLTLSPP